jgi:hypothetical protein
VHVLNAALLAAAGGTVRCGNCNREFNILAFLFDQWPDTDSMPTDTGLHGVLPVLGQPQTMAATTAPPEEEQTPLAEDPNRVAWMAIFALLLVITISNLAWTFREPLMKNSGVRHFLSATGVLEPVVEPEFRDVSRLHLVSRDMHRHPTREGVLSLSITFVNRAESAQAYPQLEVTLIDTASSPLARRKFTVAEYLPSAYGAATGLVPNVHVPVLLEFADPGADATGFELRFR